MAVPSSRGKLLRIGAVRAGSMLDALDPAQTAKRGPLFGETAFLHRGQRLASVTARCDASGAAVSRRTRPPAPPEADLP